jgi:hypothetical protein
MGEEVIPEDRLQEIILHKDAERALDWCTRHQYSEGWAIIDGAMVIYDIDNPPVWLRPILAMRDEDGNSPRKLIDVIPVRRPTARERKRGVASVTWFDFPDNNGIYESEAA